MATMDCDALEGCPAFQEAFNDPSGAHADDATWVLTSSFVILTMQSGFGLLEMGSSTPGHEVNVMLKNVFDVVFGAVSYYFLGYGISYGNPSNPFMGLGDFAPDGSPNAEIESGLLYSSYIFQFSFAATSTTIVSGCVAMRMRLSVYCAFAFYAVIVYAFVAHWVWASDGWLRQLGVHDFAGSGPVHLLGGCNGLFAILMLGPRMGRFDGTRPKSDFRANSPTSILYGLFMLWWGWIGFNCGSSFGITEKKWMVATRAAVTTINSSAGGGIAALIYTQIKTKRKYVLPGDIANGILGGLVSITASCASVHTYGALVIGFLGALIALTSNDVIEHKLHLDDPVGAVGVHAIAGLWGIVAVGLFADGDLPGIEVEDGLFRGGGPRLLGVQLLEAASIIGWSAVWATSFFYLVGVGLSRDLLDPRKGLRVVPEEEIHGADQYLHDCNTRRAEPSTRRNVIKNALSHQNESPGINKRDKGPKDEDLEGKKGPNEVLDDIEAQDVLNQTDTTKQGDISSHEPTVMQMRDQFRRSRALRPVKRPDRVLFIPAGNDRSAPSHYASFADTVNEDSLGSNEWSMRSLPSEIAHVHSSPKHEREGLEA